MKIFLNEIRLKKVLLLTFLGPGKMLIVLKELQVYII